MATQMAHRELLGADNLLRHWRSAAVTVVHGRCRSIGTLCRLYGPGCRHRAALVIHHLSMHSELIIQFILIAHTHPIPIAALATMIMIQVQIEHAQDITLIAATFRRRVLLD